jgi:hypothetical protein
VVYAFSGKGITSTRQFAVDGSHIWEWVSSLSITDQTGGVTVGSKPMMAQYGDVTICAMGAGASTVKSTGGAFSALAGAPKGEIICVHKNAVLIFNTDTSADGWAASDVGDYTNWTTGEAANGRLIDIAGAITAAIPFGDAVYVFKANAIYRMTYVGGTVNGLSSSYRSESGVVAPSRSTQNTLSRLASRPFFFRVRSRRMARIEFQSFCMTEAQSLSA